MKSNLCQGINIYGAINAYEPNSTMIKFNSAYIVTARSGSPQIMPCMSLVVKINYKYAFRQTVAVQETLRYRSREMYAIIVTPRNLPKWLKVYPVSGYTVTMVPYYRPPLSPLL